MGVDGLKREARLLLCSRWLWDGFSRSHYFVGVACFSMKLLCTCVAGREHESHWHPWMDESCRR